jgi:hypothetical protein
MIRRRTAVVAAVLMLAAAAGTGQSSASSPAASLAGPDVTVVLTTPSLVAINGKWCITSGFAVGVSNHGAFELTGELHLGTALIATKFIGSGPASSFPVNTTSTLPICGVPGGPGVYTITVVYTDESTGAQVRASTSLSARTPSRVRITAAPAPTKLGLAYVFGGRTQYLWARTWQWTGTPGAVLQLLFLRAGTTTWVPSGTVTTAADGRWVVQKTANVSGTWDVLYPGTTSVLAGSHTVPITVT